MKDPPRSTVDAASGHVGGMEVAAWEAFPEEGKCDVALLLTRED